MASSLSSKLLKNPFSVRSNIAANILANVGIAAIYFISVPLFVRYVGIEGYGLIGFFIFASMEYAPAPCAISINTPPKIERFFKNIVICP